MGAVLIKCTFYERAMSKIFIILRERELQMRHRERFRNVSLLSGHAIGIFLDIHAQYSRADMFYRPNER
jgi:hypothetical protein